MDKTYIALSQADISRLTSQGCRAEDWDSISIDPNLNISAIRNCTFRGKIRIGRGVVISNIGVHINNCTIGDNVRIEDVSVIECKGKSSFGVGTMVATVNEGGGREVPLTTSMSAQTSYIIAMYRHRTATIAKLMQMAEQERIAAESDVCTIADGAVITGCGTIRNVNIGYHARIEGAQILENGTILSSQAAPALVGYGVRAKDFIFACASAVESGTSLKRCYVGEGCVVEECFTAIDSLFFANSVCAAGEACSIFAGPYTVSHHKSSLLIAGMFSFFNAGSGANQSNHLFKTGAVHQGVHDRGCKFGSNAYVMLPARDGAFTVVLGRHSSHHDTSDFPFSYLVESEGRSMVIPAAALKSSGTMRDMAKWPLRDNRKGCTNDLVNFEAHNPYLASKIARAIEVSDNLAENNADVYSWGRTKIKSTMLRRGKQTYRMALDAALASMLEQDVVADAQGAGDWVDMAGMYAPKSAIEGLLDQVDNGKYSDIVSVREALRHIYNLYPSYARGWAVAQLPEGENIEEVIERGQKAQQTLTESAQDDARKDADTLMTTSYGIDASDDKAIEEDFKAVRKVEPKK